MTTVGLAGCVELLEDTYPEGHYGCDPADPDSCPGGYVCRPLQCPLEYSCYKSRADDRSDYTVQCVPDGTCDPEICESCLRCPGDCCLKCDEPTLLAVPPREFLVSASQAWPPGEARKPSGLDLDGDDAVDNLCVGDWDDLGRALDRLIVQRIAEGTLLVGLRFHLGEPAGPAAGQALGQVLLAEVLDATPTFDGTDRVAISPEASGDIAACGPWSGGHFDGTPLLGGAVAFPLPAGPHGVRTVTLRGARWEAYIKEDRVVAQLGGGLDRADYEAVFLPLIAQLINRAIAADPDGHYASFAELIDGQCAPALPGCQDVQPGEGECAASTPPEITPTELRCTPRGYYFYSLDLDTDGDGRPDAMSMGLRLTGVPATLVPRVTP